MNNEKRKNEGRIKSEWENEWIQNMKEEQKIKESWKMKGEDELMIKT